MSGHHHNSNAGTQNQGNSLGDRACVRQSKLYRQHESGNDVKSILGTDHLRWDTERQEGAYKGQQVFDHNKPNSVTNELRARSSDMKNEINSNYVNDWSTESGSYKNSSGKNLGGQAPRDSYRNPVNDENMLVRSKYGQQNAIGYGKAYGSSNASDYEDFNSNKNSARNSNRNGGGNASSMGGMSLSQFQSESAAYVQAPPQAAKYGHGSGNSEGFSAAMNQPERSYSNSSGKEYEYRNNIYGSDDSNSRSARAQPSSTSYGGGGSNNNSSKASNNTYAAPPQYKSAAMNKQAQSYSQAPYAQDEGNSYGGGSQSSQRGSARDDGPRGYGASSQQQQPQYGGYEDDDYQVPGIAAEGANNREGRSTRPW